MIEGTRPFRGKFHPEKTPSEAPKEIASHVESHDAEATQPHETNAMDNTRSGEMDRRAWFSALVPALGDGLVKILRASNHLQDELKQSSKPTR
jgi:hypothetical protein